MLLLSVNDDDDDASLPCLSPVIIPNRNGQKGLRATERTWQTSRRRRDAALCPIQMDEQTYEKDEEAHRCSTTSSFQNPLCLFTVIIFIISRARK